MDSRQVLDTLEDNELDEIDQAARGIVFGVLLGGAGWTILIVAYALIF